MKFSRDEVIKMLKTDVCEVVFKKTDGSIRNMKCSLKDEIITPYVDEINKRNEQLLLEGKEIKKKKENPNIVSVIDVENNGWRSFKLDTIISINEIKE